MQNEELKLLSISEATKLLGIGRRALCSLVEALLIKEQNIEKCYEIELIGLVKTWVS